MVYQKIKQLPFNHFLIVDSSKECWFTNESFIETGEFARLAFFSFRNLQLLNWWPVTGLAEVLEDLSIWEEY